MEASNKFADGSSSVSSKVKKLRYVFGMDADLVQPEFLIGLFKKLCQALSRRGSSDGQRLGDNLGLPGESAKNGGSFTVLLHRRQDVPEDDIFSKSLIVTIPIKRRGGLFGEVKSVALSGQTIWA